MKVLVTGANGYLGQGIVAEIQNNGHEVICADFSVNNIKAQTRAIACNLFSIESPFEYFGEPDCLLHLAWRDGFIHNSEAHINDFANNWKISLYDFIRIISQQGNHYTARIDEIYDYNILILNK